MLLFVKNPWARMLATGEKRVEIRSGSRYAGIRAGDDLCVNGRLRLRVVGVDEYETPEDLLSSLDPRSAGFGSREEMTEAFIECYPRQSGPIYALHVRPEVPVPRQVRLPAVRRI